MFATVGEAKAHSFPHSNGDVYLIHCWNHTGMIDSGFMGLRRYSRRGGSFEPHSENFPWQRGGRRGLSGAAHGLEVIIALEAQDTWQKMRLTC